MVKKIDENYKCEECGLRYEEKEWAQKCEKWCSEHDSCNLEVVKHSIKSERK